MRDTNLKWTAAVPPAFADGPHNKQQEVLAAIRETVGGIRRKNVKLGWLLSLVWHHGWFLVHPEDQRDIDTMSRWLIKREIDLTPKEIRELITIYDTFAPFGKEVMNWMVSIPYSTAYQLARAARNMLPDEPVLMQPDELRAAFIDCIEPIMNACREATVRDVRKLLEDAGLPMPPSRRTTERRTRAGKRQDQAQQRADVLSLLEAMAQSPTALMTFDDDGSTVCICLARRYPRSKSIEQRWADFIDTLCEEHECDRDSVFAMIMDVAMRHLRIRGRSRATHEVD